MNGSSGFDNPQTLITVSHMPYSKLHSSLVNSSLWSESDHIRILFITLLAMSDRHGCVYGSRIGLERVAQIDWEGTGLEDPWAALLSPSPDSCDRMRAPENEGRRIEEIPGGFRLLNHAYYRGLRDEDDRREQNRLAQERFRNKNKGISPNNPPSATLSRDKPESAHTDTDTDTGLSTNLPYGLSTNHTAASASPHCAASCGELRPEPEAGRGISRTSAKLPSRPPPAEANGFSGCKAFWEKHWPEKHGGAAYPWDFGKDGKALKNMLKTLGDQQVVMDYMEHFLDSTPNKFYAGHPLVKLASNLPEFASDPLYPSDAPRA